jgi:peptidoglycan/xylan/chitin deacetylase (PgdA/CDA1 family)
MRIDLNFYLPVICSVKTSEKQIAITFDDGPTSDATPIVLDILKINNIKATFFVIGKNIENNEKLIRQIYDEGHTIGNHSFSHSYFFDSYPPYKLIKDINQTNEIVEKITGEKIKYFRPPFGVTNPMLNKALKKFKFSIIGWSIRPFDGIKNETDKIIKRATKNIKPGDIVLFHDNYQLIETVLNEFITFTKNNGFKIVSLDNLLNKPL